jgi:hypothetical protein
MVLGPSFLSFVLPLFALPQVRGLTIETRSPDAHCPDLAMTQQAAEARLGTVKGEGGQSWKAVYTIVYAPDKDGNYVHLELFDPKGDRKLERDLPLAGESCATMTQAVVLVLERYFRDLGSLEDEAPAGPTSAAPETPALSPPVAPDRPSTAEAPSAVAAYRGSFTAGFGLATPPSSLALTLDARLWLPRSWQLGIGVAWSGSEVTESIGPPGARASMTSIPIRASFAWRRDLGSTDVFLGPEFLASVDRASVTGVVQSGNATRVVFGVGVGAGALIWLSRSVGLSMAASLDATLPLATSQFVVNDRQGIQQEVLRQQWIQGLFSVGLTYVTSP